MERRGSSFTYPIRSTLPVLFLLVSTTVLFPAEPTLRITSPADGTLVQPGEPVTFKVRTFRTTAGNETWDFGDGSEKVTVKSDGNVNALAKDGYAVTQHRFAGPGHYIVRVERTNDRGQKAISHLHVPVE